MSPIGGGDILQLLMRTAATPKDVIARYNAIGGEKRRQLADLTQRTPIGTADVEADTQRETHPSRRQVIPRRVLRRSRFPCLSEQVPQAAVERRLGIAGHIERGTEHVGVTKREVQRAVAARGHARKRTVLPVRQCARL